MDTTTDFESKYDILGDFFWHRLNDTEFARFIADNFSGLSLAIVYSGKLAEPTSDGIELVNQTFTNLLSEYYGTTTDKGYSNYDDFIGDAEV